MQWLDGYLNHTELPWIPLAVRNYRSLRVAEFSLPPEVSRYPGDDAGAGRERLVRGDPVVVSGNSAPIMQGGCGADEGAPEACGISMRSSARSTGELVYL